MDDGWEDLGAVAARVIEKMAPAEGGGTTGASQHDGGGRTAVILEFKAPRGRPGRDKTGPADGDRLVRACLPMASATPLCVRTKR